MDPQLSSLLATDEALTEQEKKQEELRREVENKEQMQRLLEAKNNELKTQQEEAKKMFETNLAKQKLEFEI